MIYKFLIVILLTFNIRSLKADIKFNYEVLNQFNDVIWGFDFINTNEVLLTLRGGDLILYNIKLKTTQKISGAPKVYSKGQGGLLDIRTAPWNRNLVFLSYSTPLVNSESSTALAFGELKKNKLDNVQVLNETKSRSKDNIHFGARIEFDSEKNIYLSIGDRNERDEVQNLSQHNGKVLKLNLKGQPALQNPFLNKPKMLPEIFTLGHRNPQGLALNPATQKLWLSEMGPRGGDELNIIEAGKNYGWPDVSYGTEYHGPSIGVKEKKGMNPPVTYWVPSISPSALNFYTGDQFPEWKNNLFIATLSGQHLRRLVLDQNKVLSETIYLQDKKERFRNVRTGLDGYLYLSTDSGIFARLTPKN